MENKTITTADEIAEKTKDAYSFPRYRSWAACAAMLQLRGYTDKEVEGILRSKWTRWAADSSDKRYGHATAQDLADFLDDPRNRCTPEAVRELA